MHTLIGENLCIYLKCKRLKGGSNMPPRMRAPFPPPGNPAMRSMMPRGGPSINRAGFRPPQPQRGGGSGGLLAKIFGNRGSQRANSNPFSFPTSTAAGQAASRGGSSGGLLKTLTDPNALNGFLANTEKVLNTAQQIGPMVQQYGPMVKNLPSLWKLYKGFRDLPSDSEDDASKKETPKKSTKKSNGHTKKKKSLSSEEHKESNQKRSSSENRASAPKLYI